MISAWKKISLLCVILAALVIGCAAQDNNPCLNLQTQGAMNACEAEQYAKVDANLNAVYSQLISKYESDAEFVRMLRRAQESWLKFRDADLASFYYQEGKPGAYGSAHPLCKSLALIRLTVARTKELKAMLNPEEGDVCAFEAAHKPAQEDKPVK